MRSWVAALLLMGADWAEAGALGQADFDLPEPGTSTSAGMTLWATHYYVHAADEVPTGVPLRDKAGAALTGNLSPRDWCLGAIEGTVLVRAADGPHTFNYAAAGATQEVDCAAVLGIDPAAKPWIVGVGRTRYARAKGPYGDGVAGYALVPVRSIAVDKAQIPFGSVLYIPRARGVEVSLPDGQKVKHDGYFLAADTGGAIKGTHIDVFCGVGPVNCLPGVITSDAAQGFEACLVDDAGIKARLEAQHSP